MSDIINILPDSVANQIAAGEVVDRPASAVKELLENSMDAGATQIQLILKDAGRTLIQVIDNGCGMSDSDARRCFERHATSKIHRADDLFAIRTMGFRGEALASIAAIAQVELKTRMHEAELGTCIEIEGSEIQHQEPCTCNPGTSLSIKNLFYNVPARRNFLKKDSIEFSHIEEVFKRVAIINYQVAFTLHHNGKLLYDLKSGNMAERIANIYGNAYKERFYPVNESSDVVSVVGYVSKPEFARKTRGEQYLFVNNRFIKHPALSVAVEKAYSDMIPDRYYPSYFLSLKVDSSRIDVNIHPTKTEVKFIDEHAIFAILRATTKKALGQFSLANELEFNPSTELNFEQIPEHQPQGYVPHQPPVHINTSYNPFNTNSSRNTNSGFSSASTSNSKKWNEPATDTSKWTDFFAPTQPKDCQQVEMQPISDTLTAPEINVDTNAPCFQLANKWIIGSLKSGILVVDQQRAHERILYERMMNTDKNIATQQLLFPINCTFSPADADILTEILPEINNRGFEINPLGKNVFVVTAAPTNLREDELQQIFDQMLTDYKCAMLQKFNNRDQCLCRTLARQMAIKAGKTLQQAEMQQLIADLFSCQIPNVAPDGHRTMTIIKEEDLQNLLR